MNLNLGLESLNGSARGAVVPFTPASAIEMQNASEAITNLMASLENYYGAARNAMLVKKAVKKYGKTQSIVALIGQEGLAAAQSFSMEGFWQKTKEFLIKIWEKIKEWWGRFWGMFFSVESKLSTFESNVRSSNKKLAHAAEFDGPSYKDINSYDEYVRDAVDTIKKILVDPSDDNLQSKITQLYNDYNTTQNGARLNESFGFATMHYKLELGKIKEMAKGLLEIIHDYKQFKKDIDEYTKKAIEKVKSMKITMAANAGNAFGGDGSGARDNDDATNAEQDLAVKTLKQAAKINNQLISGVVKAATTLAIKLMAHTRLVD